jgi:adenylate cyclase
MHELDQVPYFVGVVALRLVMVTKGSFLASLIMLLCMGPAASAQLGAERSTATSDVSCAWWEKYDAGVDLEGKGEIAAARDMATAAHALAEHAGDIDLRARSHMRIGLLHYAQRELSRALFHWMKALELVEQAQDQVGIAEVSNYLGVVHHDEGQHERSLAYLHRALEIRQRIGDRKEIALLWNNLGTFEEDLGNYQQAMAHYGRSLTVWEELGEDGWKALAWEHIGSCHRKLGDLDSAEHALLKGEALLPKATDRVRLPIQMGLGWVYLDKGLTEKAIQRCRKALDLASAMRAMHREQESCLCLARAYAMKGDHVNELLFFKRSVTLKDSLARDHQLREMAIIQANYRFDKRQLADSLRREEERLRSELVYTETLNSERETRNLLLYSTFGVLLLTGALWHRLRYIRKSRELVRMERDRADQLLSNMLPQSVAAELKSKGSTQAREYPQATVLFTDFEGFTGLTEKLGPRELVSTIDTCFKAFDEILRAHGVEKIKTVGDCYMACGGVPDPGRGSPADVVLAALRMQEYLREQRAVAANPFRMRVGIHTGPVVGGIVGLDRFAFDIWGDTVNTAARMENSGMVDRVNISEHTRSLLMQDGRFGFEARGMVQTKGKGLLQMYFVDLVQGAPQQNGRPPHTALADRLSTTPS